MPLILHGSFQILLVAESPGCPPEFVLPLFLSPELALVSRVTEFSPLECEYNDVLQFLGALPPLLAECVPQYGTRGMQSHSGSNLDP